MQDRISLQSRRELAQRIRERYNQADWKEKTKILDGLIASTGYGRKYAITLLNFVGTKSSPKPKTVRHQKYDEDVKQALITVWLAANQICGKRLVPFLPELVSVLENRSHLSLPAEVRERLLKISAATVDRLLKANRQESNRGIPTTKPGGLLKKQIPIRTFADWNEATPGFLEADLVAHCGTRTDGAFLNTLVLTDIASGWTEFLPLLQRSESNVIAGLTTAQDLLPFPLQGLDTDNGSEFINYKLLAFCEAQKITFTRSRAYHKNDQAHVEEKNGSIVRRLVGYDRYVGEPAWYALSELYAVLRLYINFFQPSMKLISKERYGAKVTKRYDKAKTPSQRLLACAHVSEKIKQLLQKQYEVLDPLHLLKELERLQNQFWSHAWKDAHPSSQVLNNTNLSKIDPTDPIDMACQEKAKQPEQKENQGEATPIRRYRRTLKPRKQLAPRTWRTRKDAFETVWSGLVINLQLNQRCSPKDMLIGLIKGDPRQFNLKQLRSLQRRVANWRIAQSEYERSKQSDGKLTPFLSLAVEAAK
jgi:hypothetical protein